MSTIMSEEISYGKSVSAHGNYKFLRITPIGSSAQSPTLSITSTVQTQFELPNNVLNLSRSKLCFDVNIAQSAANQFNMLYGNALSLIDRITLTSRSGVILADIPYCSNFGALISAVNTKSDELLKRSALPMNNVNLIQATCAAQVAGLSLQVSASWKNTTLPTAASAAGAF